MKTAIHLLAALAMLACGSTASAQAKKKEPAPAAPPTAPATAPAAKDVKPVKPLPMNARADEIDVAAKTFTQNTRDGRKVKHVITSNTTIKQGEAEARFEDIKVGDTIAGSRIKKNAEGTEYEVVKITKFGPKPKAPEKK
jgi:hypothetical protein